MENAKPANVAEFVEWLEAERRVKVDKIYQNHYELLIQSLKQNTEGSSFWEEVRKQIPEFDVAYYQKTGFYLLTTRDAPELVTKPYNSLLDKAFRKNVVLNKNFPNPPEEGWWLPNNWLSRMNDIIRTSVVVKYLDGVDFLAERLRKLSEDLKLKAHVDYEAREEGYYAAHVYIYLDGEIPKINWDTEKIGYSFEIQIATQLQDVIRPITQPFYIRRRSQPPPEGKWQWNFLSDEFRCNYLAHTLHHVDGLILDVRNRTKARE